jgi:hypothetical protein
VSGAHRACHTHVGRRALIAEPAAGRGQRRAPQHARRTAGLRRPGFAGRRQYRADSAATLGRGVGRSAGRLGPANHAAAVVAVAGDRVDPAQFAFHIDHPRCDRPQCVRDVLTTYA